MRVVWRTVGGIISRVAAEAETLMDRFAGLRGVGIDEISYRKGQNYLTVVVDHTRRRLVWAAPGRATKTLSRVFGRLGGARPAGRAGAGAVVPPWEAPRDPHAPAGGQARFRGEAKPATLPRVPAQGGAPPGLQAEGGGGQAGAQGGGPG